MNKDLYDKYTVKCKSEKYRTIINKLKNGQFDIIKYIANYNFYIFIDLNTNEYYDYILKEYGYEESYSSDFCIYDLVKLDKKTLNIIKKECCKSIGNNLKTKERLFYNLEEIIPKFNDIEQILFI